jgi:hypothetical protein
MSKKPRKIHLKILIGSDLYVLGTLSFNLAKREIYYLFHYSEMSPKKLLDIGSNRYIETPIHISWHQKCVHIRTEATVLHSIEYPNGDIFPATLDVRPLLVESITLNDTPTLLRRDDAFTNFEDANECRILQLPQASNFSLVLMLVPSNWATSDLFLKSHISGDQRKKIPLWYLRNESHKSGRIMAFKGWDLSVWTTPFVRNMNGAKEKFPSGCRMLDFSRPAESLFDLATQAKHSPMLTSQQLAIFRLAMNAPVNQKIQKIKTFAISSHPLYFRP